MYLRNQKCNYDRGAIHVTNIIKSGGYYNFLGGNIREEQIDYLQKKMATYQFGNTGFTVTKGDELPFFCMGIFVKKL